MRSGRNTAKNDMAEILSQNYTEGAPDIICTGADDLALGAVMPWRMQDMCLERMAGL